MPETQPATSPQDFDPRRSGAQLIVYLDIKSPYAFLAVQPTRALEQQLGVAFDWRPLTLDIPSYLGSAKLDSSGKVTESKRTPAQWGKVKYAYRDARRYAAIQGYPLRGTEKIWDTSLIHRAMDWLKLHQPANDNSLLHTWLDLVYPPFWQRQLDVEDPAVVSKTLADAGVPTAGFLDWAENDGARWHQQTQQAVFDAGIFGVPNYVLGEENFFGREHLGRVAWRLSGRQGPEPDIAYPAAGAVAPTGTALDTSSLDSITGGARLTLAMDLGCPYAWLALEPLLAWLAGCGLSTVAADPTQRVQILPLSVVRPKPPLAPAPEADRGALHRFHRSHWMHEDLARRATRQGVSLARFLSANDQGNNGLDAAHAALMAANSCAAQLLPEVLRALYQGWWHGQLDANDPVAVADLLSAQVPGAGCNWLEAITSSAGQWQQASGHLADLGLFRAPAMVLDGEPFQGLEHLPLLDRRLAAL